MQIFLLWFSLWCITGNIQVHNTYQFDLGQDILVDVARHVSRALHGHRMYFFPAGGALMG